MRGVTNEYRETVTIWRGLTGRDALTSADSNDPALSGRTYAIPFDHVWEAVLGLAAGGLIGWRVAHSDDYVGIVEADVRSVFLPLPATVMISVTLDEDGQTRVDASARGLHRGVDLGMNRRRIIRFFRALDRSLGARPEQILTARRLATVAVAAMAISACAESADEGQRIELPGTSAISDVEAAAPDYRAGATYLRTVVFLDTSTDTTMFVPWDFENLTEADGIRRSVRGWLGRGTQWLLFMEDEWVTQPSRYPWRILPRGSARLVVGQDDALQEIYYEEGVRRLSVRLGEVVVEWSDPLGSTFRLHNGTARLSEAETDGLVLDVFTARATESARPAEWVFLIGGDQLQLLLADQEGRGPYRAWARQDSEDLFWPSVTMTWEETRSFERARRDIPLLWRFESSDGQLSGEFQPVSAHHQALDGSGPILPVLAVYEVEGQVTTNGTQIPVKGFLRHSQR